MVALVPSLLRELNMGADKLAMPADERELFFATLAPCHSLALKAIVLEDEALPQPVRVETRLSLLPESHEFEVVPVTDQVRNLAPVPPASARTTIAGLDAGNWIACTDEAGTTTVTRLSWISPLKGIYLFANAQGQSVLSITARGLQMKLQQGTVELIDDVPLMDRVVGNRLAFAILTDLTVRLAGRRRRS